MRPRKVVLLVEANELRRSTFTFLLDTWGFVVISAPSANEALRLVCGAWTYDVAMCNLLPPDMAGDELALTIKRLRPDVRVLLFSTLVDELVDTPNRYGDAYLLRGFDHNDLRNTLRLLCARKRGPKKAGSRRTGPVAENEAQYAAAS